MRFYRLELQDKFENLLQSYDFTSYKQFKRKYNELSKKYYYSAVLYAFTYQDEDNLTEFKDLRIYYNGLYEVKKKKKKAPFIIITTLLYIITTPFAVLIKLGKSK
jgi:hypothetical protein